jgi:hypothetical protein
VRWWLLPFAHRTLKGIGGEGSANRASRFGQRLPVCHIRRLGWCGCSGHFFGPTCRTRPANARPIRSGRRTFHETRTKGLPKTGNVFPAFRRQFLTWPTGRQTLQPHPTPAPNAPPALWIRGGIEMNLPPGPSRPLAHSSTDHAKSLPQVHLPQSLKRFSFGFRMSMWVQFRPPAPCCLTAKSY